MTSWLNRSAGTAPRNGTTSHTISFTAASSGSLLVALVAGSVTNTTPTGWTKQLGPINGTELSVFTKTATAGESSFSTTHNASNYPSNWAVYEFPAGSTWAGGTSAANATSWPTLSSLTGTNTVFGAISEGQTSADVSTFSGTATSPWVEDVDEAILNSAGTDGDWLYVLFQDNYSSATATPANTDTSARNDERVVFAIAVAAAGTATFVPAWPSRRRTLPPRRTRPPGTPVRAQVNPPAPPIPAHAIRQQRGLLVRRAEIAMPVPAQQAAAQAPAMSQRVTRERVKLLLARARQRGDLAPPPDQPAPVQPRGARRRLLPRREQNIASPAAIPVGPPPHRLAARRRWVPARRSDVAVPVPTQIAIQPPPYPPSIAKVRRWWALPRRAEVAVPVPAQQTVVPPTYPPSITKTRRFAVLVRRGQRPAPVPAQIVATPPAYPPGLAKVRRIAGAFTRRGHAPVPTPAQASPAPPAWPPAPPHIRRMAATVRRPQASVPVRPQASPVPLVVSRPRRAAARRGRVATPVAPQVILTAPFKAPGVVRGLRRFASAARRTRPGVWLFGGTGITTTRGSASILGRSGSSSGSASRAAGTAQTTARDTSSSHIEEV